MNISEHERIRNLEIAVFGGPNVAGTIPGANNQAPIVTKLTGSTDALPLFGDVAVGSAGVDAMTLGAPAAGSGQNGGNDGSKLRVTDIGGHAHTITLGSNNLAPSHHLLTFNGTIGSFVDLEAYNGLWYVKQSNGVTAS